MEVEFVLKRLISMECMKLNGLIDKAPLLEKNPKKAKKPQTFIFHLKAEKSKISPLFICLPWG